MLVIYDFGYVPHPGFIAERMLATFRDPGCLISRFTEERMVAAHNLGDD